jgi:dTDP-4-amino-4,6-dideoxygalactose transaminase
MRWKRHSGNISEGGHCVHLYGLTADLEKIVELCKKNTIPFSLRTPPKALAQNTRANIPEPSVITVFFHLTAIKSSQTSGGGMLVSENSERVEKVRFWATQSRDRARHYQHSELGYNYRMSNIVAGIGRGQLKVLNQRIRKKKYIFDFYRKSLGA